MRLSSSSACAHGERFGQPGDFGRHHGAGGAFGIGLQAQDVAPLVDRARATVDALRDFLVDGVEQVDAVVGRHVGDRAC